MQNPKMKSILIALIPYTAMCFSVSLWDRIYPFVLGLPFNMFWVILWIILTPMCMIFAYRIEENAAQDTPKQGGGITQ